MTCEVRIPAGRGLLRPVLLAVQPARLPLWDAGAGEWVLAYGAAAEAARAYVTAARVAAFKKTTRGRV